MRSKNLSENRGGEGDSPILLRRLRKIGTVPDGFHVWAPRAGTLDDRITRSPLLLSHVLLTFVLAISLMHSLSLADDFRIETKVFVGKDKSSVSQTTTLFKAGYVYDYLSSPPNPEQVAVFDKQHGRFILLDPSRKLKTEIRSEDVLVFARQCQALAGKSSNAFLKFAADPEFETDFSAGGELTLSSQFINYRLQTEPANTPEAAQQYREFSDWYARFNAMSNPESTPPFARLVVNEELASRGLVPTEVQLTISAPSKLGRMVAVRSEHHVSWRLLKRDEEKIADTANQLATFKSVTFAEFQPTTGSKR
ncbi:MAG: hypothetical protein HY288_06665 [Planctomycetia bacterium]|nr:hypothetical protein [Planctomycetia bacterium]